MSWQRERKSSSSMTNSGVPYSWARWVTATPPMTAAPVSSRVVLRGQTFGANRSSSSGDCGRSGLRRDGFRRRAEDRRDGRSHSLRGRDAENRQPVGDDLAGGLAQRQAGGVQAGGLLVALG